MKKLFLIGLAVVLSANLLAQSKKSQQTEGKNTQHKKEGAKSELYGDWPVAEGGIPYKIHETKATERKIIVGDMISIHMLAAVLSTDSIIISSYQNNNPYEIPANEPTLGPVFSKLRNHDSVSFVIVADTLFKNSFGQDLPNGLKPGDKLMFHCRVVEVKNEKEIKAAEKVRNIELEQKDSIAIANALKLDPKWKKTASGLYYQILQGGNGKKPAKGNKVTVSYIGQFLDGTVFDKSDAQNPDFTFIKNESQVIPGFEEGIDLMEEGSTAKFIIPWQLAYGELGTGPIAPYTSLQFEIKLIKINTK